MRRMSKLVLAVVVVLAVSLLARPAAAQSIIKNPGDHPSYNVELEPHFTLGWGHLYRGGGFGLGGRVGLPIVENGFVPSINNSVAISLGLDWIRYSDCYYYHRVANARTAYGCGASYFVFPVAMQWNFWLTPRWSVFGEPGLYIYHGVWDDYCLDRAGNVIPGCGYPTRTGVDIAFYAGGRFHFNDKVALTMRLGYPTASIGVSFLF
jgi:hypothetical protein